MPANTSVLQTDSTSGTQEFVGLSVSEGIRIFALVVGWLYCVSGVFGNILIIVTLLTQRSLRSLHNLYVGNLAVADLIVVSYCVPLWLLDLMLGRCPVLNETHCSVNSFLLHLSVNTSIFTLVLIGYNRYLSVASPSTYRKVFTRNRTVGFCLATWLLSVLQGTIPFTKVGHTAYHYSVTTRICTYDGSYPGNVFSVLLIIDVTVATILVGFFSFSIYRYWRKSKSRIGQWNGAVSKSQKTLRVVKLTRESNKQEGKGQAETGKAGSSKDMTPETAEGSNPDQVQPGNHGQSSKNNVELDAGSGSETSNERDKQRRAHFHEDPKEPQGATTEDHHQREAAGGKGSRPRLSSADISLIRSLVLVFVLVVVLYIPIAVAVALFGRVNVPPDAFCLCLLCFFLNQSINWIVYGLLNKNFKNGYKRLLFGRCSRNTHGATGRSEFEPTLHTVGTHR